MFNRKKMSETGPGAMNKLCIKGNPKWIDFKGWLEGCVNLVGSKKDDDTLLEFKVLSLDHETRESAELLLALAQNNPRSIRYEIWAGEDEAYLMLNPELLQRGKHDSYRLGVVPLRLAAFLSQDEVCTVFSRCAEAIEYSVGLSIVGKEIDKNKIMEIADTGELEVLSDLQFAILMDSLKVTMDQEVYVTKVRFKLSSQLCKLVPRLMGDEDERGNNV
jgi:hypothetical protein